MLDSLTIYATILCCDIIFASNICISTTALFENFF